MRAIRLAAATLVLAAVSTFGVSAAQADASSTSAVTAGGWTWKAAGWTW